jgi:hypothetical protein
VSLSKNPAATHFCLVQQAASGVISEMFIADLSTCAYFATNDNLRAVGWLEAGHPYQQGPVREDFLTRLKQHVATAYQPLLFLGFHNCSLCPPGQRKTGLLNLLIPTGQLLYVTPGMVVHYIEDHGYRPPQEFIEAVMACPPQEAAAYSALLKPFEQCWEGDA